MLKDAKSVKDGAQPPTMPVAKRRLSALGGILRQVCPRCREGKIFEKWLTVRARCPVCGWTLVREKGFFLGAMYISYALVIPPLTAITLLLWLFVLQDWPIYWVLTLALGCFLPLAPAIVQLSRVLYFYLEYLIEADSPQSS